MPSQQHSEKQPGFGTNAVHAGLPHDPTTGALSEQICLATTFPQPDINQPASKYIYSRSNNPNRESFEQALATLEHAKHALAFSSGLAATAAVIHGLVAPGGHVICNADLYGGTYRFLARLGGVTVDFAPSLERDMAMLVRDDTQLIWIETPSNPTLSLVDIRAVTEIAHAQGIVVVVDSTMLSPYLQNPLDHGADIVLHSVTKYINGHSDVLMGAVAFNSDDLKQKLAFVQTAAGAVPSPFDCWLAHRGLKTLHLRVHAASAGAAALASLLEASPHVLAVNYPGLPSHPQRQIAQRQHRAGMGGAMVSFRIRGGGEAAARFCKATKYFTLAESLGGVESLCEIPARMTHASMPREARESVGVYDDLVRLSIGVEEVEDLKGDLELALAEAVKDE
ncbi:Cystathionine gamma-lyase [Colletotrichum fructicola]|uniref:cystathionine gamma-lyase n=1 Tax=Colletotrichum fructicola (strain Nara gc5) TaxID=1213859 RepID=A0A7J6IHF6_COLFN|nr:Cystathionine gamma-lyase [Colletotrichum fructicola]KAF4475996.1 Cystathionine gamma-lyase [Colletotrichum fructicola Nara gc5]KAI8274700.1 Cystathionine gamma-lyase [Colletotrichum sp. SAR11_57]KAE9581364.1 Cystathionine gamma-lyase [Colletotrichum fructicola]KAF4433189.1 Cystathionine gamma-lyase [Colletotrichum fructicola]KAF4881724.1 Cystathionine gamma-lyase [Colletotrichum fructicola]